MLWVLLTDDTEEEQGYEHVCLSPVSSYLSKNYVALRGKYLSLKVSVDDDKAASAKLMLFQKIINLHKRFDDPDRYGFDVYRLSDNLLDHLSDLSQFDLLNADSFPDPEDEDYDDNYAPPWQSGDNYLDWTADLLYSFNTYGEIKQLFLDYSRSEIACIMKRLRQLHKGKEARKLEKAKKSYHKKMQTQEGVALMDELLS